MADLKIKASKGSRLLVVFMVLAIIFVVVLSFFKYFVKKDFILYIKETCDPNAEVCFVHECEKGDTRCSLLSDGMFYYKIIYQKQHKTPTCTDVGCPPITCTTDDANCSVYYCSEENLTKFDLEDFCSSNIKIEDNYGI